MKQTIQKEEITTFVIGDFLYDIEINDGRLYFKLPKKSGEQQLIFVDEEGSVRVSDKSQSIIFDKEQLIENNLDYIKIENNNLVMRLQVINELGVIRLKLNEIEPAAEHTRLICAKTLEQFNEFFKEKAIKDNFKGINTNSKLVMSKVKEGIEKTVKQLANTKKILTISYQNAIYSAPTFLYMSKLDLKQPMVNWFFRFSDTLLEEIYEATAPNIDAFLKKQTGNVGFWKFYLQNIDRLITSLEPKWISSDYTDIESVEGSKEANIKTLEYNEYSIMEMLKIADKEENK